MQLNTKVYDLQENKTSKSFDFWIRLRTCDEKKNILIPLKSNSYFNKFEGVICNSIQLNFDKNKLSNIILCKDIKDKKDYYISKTDTIGIDIGLSTLIATDKGDLFSPNFMRRLIVYDKKIQFLQKELQKRGYNKLNLVSKRYSLYNKQLRSFIKNEVNRILNRITKLYKPNTIGVEDLLFSNPNLSRRTNRLLSNFGLSVIKDKLKSLNEMYGVNLKFVNPAYTSQTCSGCGYVSKTNRVIRDTFKCKCCKLELDADVNGARVIKGRSLDERFTLKMNKSNILKLIINDFIVNNKGKYSSKSWTALNQGNKYFDSVI
jgi:putative transposase